MQRVWVVEDLIEGEWTAIGGGVTRELAREEVASLRNTDRTLCEEYLHKYRIRKYVPAEQLMVFLR